MTLVPFFSRAVPALALTFIFAACDGKKETTSSSANQANSEAESVEAVAPSAAFLKLQKKLHEAAGDPLQTKKAVGGMKSEGMTPAEFFRLIGEYVPEDRKQQLVRNWFYDLSKKDLPSVKEAYALLETPEQREIALRSSALFLQKSDPVAYYLWLKGLGEEKYVITSVKRSIAGLGTLPKGSTADDYLARMDGVAQLKLDEKMAQRVYGSLIYGLGRDKVVDQSFLEKNLIRFPQKTHSRLYIKYIERMSAADLIKNYHSLKIPDKMRGATDRSASGIVAKELDLKEALAFVEDFPELKQRSLRVNVLIAKGMVGDGENVTTVLKAIDNKGTFRVVSGFFKRRYAKGNPGVVSEIEAMEKEWEAKEEE